MTTTRFFVYGSMTEGFVHFSKIKAFVQSSQPGFIKGAAYRLKVGFPVVLAEGSDKVTGQLLEIKTSDLLLGLLDEFHGVHAADPSKSLFHKHEVTVLLESGEVVSALAYLLNPAKLPKDAKVIEGGDWVAALREQPPLTSQLSERQASYIQRLGRSTGREIVPIDLALYRELMNLELIVDKGRRLALSKAGQEVYRYLG